MDSLNKVYQQAAPYPLGQKKLAANICRLLGRDPKTLESRVQPQHANGSPNASQQTVTASPVSKENPIADLQTQQSSTATKEPIRKRFADRVKRAASTTWAILTPFLNNTRDANQREDR